LSICIFEGAALARGLWLAIANPTIFQIGAHKKTAPGFTAHLYTQAYNMHVIPAGIAGIQTPWMV
jgi:hypothetical protein